MKSLLVALSLCLLPAAASPPNLIFILADDMGWGDPACYGGKIPTPHIDRIAREGMRFTDAHTTSAVCTPTRYSIRNGRSTPGPAQPNNGHPDTIHPRILERFPSLRSEGPSKKGQGPN